MLNDTSANYPKKKKKCMYINFNQFTFTLVKLIQRLLFFYQYGQKDTNRIRQVKTGYFCINLGDFDFRITK